ncbi:hypothetical protein Goklo_008280 [Gossypium klotzschianum]|uniref:Glutamate synthase alpha subunit C-terminal domain-containing protein n=1 Tax=Gossypium klotzschianum TaxID=34286 RepID=A0A7J8UZA4_9ROSI|nr:hypothetical protein [Gossypium klotzschianum]
MSQLDAKLDAKLKATFKEFKDEFKGELRSELYSLFGQYLGYQNLSMRNTKTLVRESVDKDIANHKPIKPSSIESTPFQLGKEVKDLELATTLRNVDKFAVDLEYAREDTRYLLHIYDFMRIKLLPIPKDLVHFVALLVDVYKKSSDIQLNLGAIVSVVKYSIQNSITYEVVIYFQVRGILPKWGSTAIRAQEVHSNGLVLNDSLLVDLEVSHAIENEKEVHKTTKIYNTDQAVCGRIAANDYVGNGMAEGEVVVTPKENFGFYPEGATIVGNTCLYGAIGG